MKHRPPPGRANAGLHFTVPGAGLLLLLLLTACTHREGARGYADGEAAVRTVLVQRQRSIEALLEGRVEEEAANWSSSFVANTPDNGVVEGAELRRMLDEGSVGYRSIQMDVEYAAAHGPDMVVIMGTEQVVPGPGMRNAGRLVTRRFTDVFRLEHGEWRHDLRHASVTGVE